jgi:CubicO group peptidase (beta-lactamase class C family)
MIEIVEPSDRGAPRLSAETVDDMLTPQMRVNDSISWGLGWGLQHTDDRLSFWQWGDNGGYKNFAIANRERGEGVVVLTNGANGLKLCEELIPMAMRGPQPAFGEFLNVARDRGYII